MQKVQELAKEGKINLFTKYQLKDVKGSNNLESIDIMHDNKEVKNLKTDIFFAEIDLECLSE